jgi:predicted RNA-binding protein with TRAM domain
VGTPSARQTAGVQARLASAVNVTANTASPCPPVSGQPAGGTPKIMVVGDSISQGSSGDYTWRYRLYKHLVSDGLSPQLVGPYNWLFNNVTSVQGDCSYADPVFENAHDSTWGQMLANEVGTIQGEVAASHPDYLLVLLGINDLSFGTSDVAGLEANLRSFIANARAGNPNLKIVLGLLLPKASEPAALAAQVAQYNSDLPGIAAQVSTAASPVVVADDASAIDTANDLWDGTHPNAEGEIKIAAGFGNALASDFGLGAQFPTPLPTVPTGPLVAPQLTLTPGDGQAQLSWTPTPGATGYMVWVEDVTAGDTAFNELPYPVPGTSWTAGLLVNGATYQFKLQACKGVNCNVFSNVAGVAPSGPTPAAPTGLTATPGDGQAVLSWTAAANATGYFVYVKNDSAGETSFTKLPYPVPGTIWTAGLMVNGDTYEFEMQSVNGMITGGTTAPVTVTPTGPTPAAPTGLTITPGDGQAVLSWTPAAHATGYYVLEENVTQGETSLTKLPYPVSGSTWTSADMINGDTYKFELQSVNGAILGGTTAPVTVTPTGPTPAAPTGLTITPGDGQAVLSWTPAADATGYFVLVENVTNGETTFTKLPYPVTGSTWTAGLMVNGDTYKFELQSVNGDIPGGTTAPVSVTPTAPPPPAPTGLAVTNGNKAATLTWTAAAGATGYFVLVKNVTAGDTTFTTLPYPVSGTSWKATLLVNGATYQFKLQSVDGAITGGTSAAVTAQPTGPAPAAPSDLAAAPGNGEAILTWTLPANATCVYILTRTGTSGSFTTLPYPVCSDHFTAGLLVNGQTYQFEVKAYDDLIPGGTSGAVTVTPRGPAPPGPEQLTATPRNQGAVLQWNQASGATGYYIWVKADSFNGSWTQLPYAVSGDTFNAGDMANGAQYEYKIQSLDGLETGGFSNTVTVTPLGPTPQAPGDLTASNISWKGTANLTWTPSGTATGYYINVSDNGGSWTQLPYPVSGGSWAASLMIPGHTYKYQLHAISGLQLGTWSNIVTVAIPLPPKPTGLTATATAASPYTAKLSWNPVAGADGYYIYIGHTQAIYDFPTMTRLPYMVTSNHFNAGYLFTPGIQWFAVTAVKYGAQGPQSGLADAAVYMLNDDYYTDEAEYLSGASNSFFKSLLVNVGSAGPSNYLYMARAFIQPNDPFSDAFADHSGFSAGPGVQARAVIAWDPARGVAELLMSPTCPLGAACKSALSIAQTGAGPIPLKPECGSVLSCIGSLGSGPFSNNLVNVTGGSKSVSVFMQLADSYATIPGINLEVPGAIDGSVTFSYSNANSSTIALNADRYPAWEIIAVPKYTVNGYPESDLIGTRGQSSSPYYLCTTCYGQVYNSWSR